MTTKYVLGVTDYAIIGITLLFSSAIGIAFRFVGSKQKTTSEYLLAGKNMPMLPVVGSIVATMTSAVSMIGMSSDVYRYGAQPIVFFMSVGIGMILAAYVFVPVYFQCGVITIYEILEMRFGKATKYIISIAFSLHIILYMSVVLFTPVVAICAVTHFSMKAAILIFGSICTIYCAVGGLKAVLWTDVFQFILMISSAIVILISGIIDSGGISNVYDRIAQTGRFQFFELTPDWTKRYTFWNCVLRGVVYGFAAFGTTQMDVQRLLSMKNSHKAKSALIISSCPLVVLNVLFASMGLVLFSVFHSCDPISDKEHTGIEKYDQIVPYYIVKQFSGYAGLTGFCMAGIFCGSLSTVSSALNSLATVTVINFVRPFWPTLSDLKTVLIAKGFSVLYGVVCIVFAFIISNTSSIIGTAGVFIAFFQDPIAAVFTFGVLTKNVSQKSVLIGLFCAVAIQMWIGLGSMAYGQLESPLPFSTNSCPSNDSLEFRGLAIGPQNFTSTKTPETQSEKSEIFSLYKISYMWMNFTGFTLTIIFTSIAHLLTGCRGKRTETDPRLTSPVTHLWRKRKTSSEVISKPSNENVLMVLNKTVS